MLFLALAVGMTWPAASDPTRRFAAGTIDPPFTMWTMSWEVHALETAPEHFFDANIFYPEQGTLAFSTLNLAPMLLGLPIWLATRNPILTYNFVYFITWGLIGWGTFLLGIQLGLGFRGGLVAGALAAFSSFTFGQISHLEILWFGWIPLFLVAADIFLKHGTPRNFFWLLVLFLNASLATWYWALYLSLVAVALALYVARRMPWRLGWRWGGMVAVVGVGWILMSPLLMPYLHIEKGYATSRTITAAESFSAQLDSYVQVPGWNKTWASWLAYSEVPESNLFPGLVFILLAVPGSVQLWRDDGAHGGGRFLILLGLVSLVLTLGPTVRVDNQSIFPAPERLLRLLPGYAFTRVPTRWDGVATLAFAICAGASAARLAQVRGGNLALAALLGLALFENFSVPLPTATMPTRASVAPVYRWLARQPAHVVVELPMPSEPKYTDRRVLYMYNSIFHWQPEVNGYSDYVPGWYETVVMSSFGFPESDAVKTFQKLGVQWVIVHGDQLKPSHFHWIMSEVEQGSPGQWLHIRARFGKVVVLELEPDEHGNP